MPACPVIRRRVACAGSTGRSRATCACSWWRWARNDGLRGLPASEMKKNLKAVLDRAKARNIPVVLAGMEAPPNNGPDYTREFRRSMRSWRRNTRCGLCRSCCRAWRGTRRSTRATGFIPTLVARRSLRISCGRNWNRRCRVPIEEAASPQVLRPSSPHDSTSRRQQDRSERRPSSHHPSSARSRRAGGPLSRDHRAVGQRQVDAARAGRRSRFGVDRHHHHRRHRDHEPR